MSDSIATETIKVFEFVLRTNLPEGLGTNRKTFPRWDSLKNIEIIFALEDRFKVRFSQEELDALESVKDFATAIAQKTNGP